jgi:hypothetical protein
MHVPLPAGMRAPYIVIDHNGQQHQTDVMKGEGHCLSAAAVLSSSA